MWAWLIIVAIAWLIWRYSRPGSDCVIRFHRGELEVRGNLSPGRRAEVDRFLREQFPEAERLRIEIRYPRGAQPLQVRISGSISRGERQQIRNFLTTAL